MDNFSAYTWPNNIKPRLNKNKQIYNKYEDWSDKKVSQVKTT